MREPYATIDNNAYTGRIEFRLQDVAAVMITVSQELLDGDDPLLHSPSSSIMLNQPDLNPLCNAIKNQRQWVIHREQEATDGQHQALWLQPLQVDNIVSITVAKVEPSSSSLSKREYSNASAIVNGGELYTALGASKQIKPGQRIKDGKVQEKRWQTIDQIE